MRIPIAVSLVFHCCSYAMAQTSVLVITGGHDFEEQEFFEIFESFDAMEYKHLVQPQGNEMIETGELREYDAIVFYDMIQSITDAQKKAYLKALDQGTGMVFLHHALVSYQDWPEFKNIIGGKYLLEKTVEAPKSTYKHDVNIDVRIVDPKHPVTRDFEDFQILDEVYGSFIVNESVTPLLKTNHPESTETIAWCHVYGNSRIVYLQSGHDRHAYKNVDYRALVKNAIYWVSDSSSR
ncbi:MAG: ThuA domain-containing protein [Cytophagales bacterium]|nr:ThuA domain-containing protein [Cytophagales bacterium]